MNQTDQQKKRAVIYARVSSDEQRLGNTIDGQTTELESYAESLGWQVVGKYLDNGVSGALLDRPELDQLRIDAEKKIFDAVLITKVDRLSRDSTNLGIILKDLERKNIQVQFKDLPSEKNPFNDFFINMMGGWAQFERALILDRTRIGRKVKVEVRKQYLGGNTKYGLRYHPKDRGRRLEGFLELAPEEALVVQKIYDWCDRGESARKIINLLFENKIPSPKGGAKWAKSTVLNILHSETYAGVWHYYKYASVELSKSKKRRRPKSEWFALELPEQLRIIGREQWERVQNQLRKNTAFSKRNSKHSYLLKGLIRCGGCGSAYVGDPSHGSFCYRCMKRCKKYPIISERILDSVVWNAVEEALKSPKLITSQLEVFKKRKARTRKAESDKIKNLEGGLDKLKSQEGRVLEAYRLGIFTPQQLQEELEKIKHGKESILVEIDKLKLFETASTRPIKISIQNFCRRTKARLKTLSFEEKQKLLRLLVNSVIFEGKQVRIRGIIPTSSLAQGELRAQHSPLRAAGNRQNAPSQSLTFDFTETYYR
jgi:site-specific DNA recombinase